MSKRRPHSLSRQKSRERRNRRSKIEQLETRLMLDGGGWQNPARPLDVNNDGQATAYDALLVINQLSRNGVSTPLGERPSRLSKYFDTSGDGNVSALDALQVINGLNRAGGGPVYPTLRAEGESELAPAGFISMMLGVLPGDDSQLVELSTQRTFGAEDFNELGFFVTDDAEGYVDGLAPEHPDYPQAVFDKQERHVVHSRLGLARDSHTVTFTAGQHIGVYIMQEAVGGGVSEDHLQVTTEDANSMSIGWEMFASPSSIYSVGNRGYDDVKVTVEVGEPYDPNATPVIEPIADQTIDELSELTLTIQISDADHERRDLSIEYINGPGVLVSDDTSLSYTWTPTEAEGPGEYEFSFRVTDPEGASTTETFAISVLEVNQAPVLQPIQDLNVEPGETVTFTAVATDADVPANALTYSLGDDAPPGASIDPASGAFQWITPDDAVGETYQIDVSVFDGAIPNLSDTESFTVNVGNCTFDQNLTDWLVNESGGTDQGRGTVIVQDCAAVLTEGDSFTVSLDTSFTVPESGGTVKFTYSALGFDKTDNDFINDAFEVALVDRFGNPIVDPFKAGRDAFLNVTEDNGMETGDAVTVTMSDVAGEAEATVEVDVDETLAGEKATLIFRLANNDADQESRVAMQSVAITDSSSRNVAFSSLQPTPDTSGSSTQRTISQPIRLERSVEPSAVSSPLVVSSIGGDNPTSEINGQQIGRVQFFDFASPEQLVLNGAASVVETTDGSVLRITPARRFQTGSVFSETQVNAADFSTAFSFRISDPGGGVSDCDSETGADGIVFVVQSVSSGIGSFGQGIGYAGIQDSIGVEFDTWCNPGNNDPNSNHVAINLGGSVNHGAGAEFTATVQPNFDNGELWYSWVDYDGAILEVRLSQTDQRPADPVLSRELDVPSLINSSTAFVGFTSGTGSNWGNHDIVSWQYRDRFDPVGEDQISLVASISSNRVEAGTTQLISGTARVFAEVGNTSNSIIDVRVNGRPVDILDPSGNFFALINIEPGVNSVSVSAIDERGDSASLVLEVDGISNPLGAIDFSQFTDTTGSFSGVYGRTSFNEQERNLYVDLSTRNDGVFESDVPLLVGVRNISDPTVSVIEADGVMPDGTPYYDFTGVVDGGTLKTDETSGPLTIAFHNRLKNQFDYELVFLGKLNEAPVITTIPTLEAPYDREYTYDVDAIDADNDRLTFSLMVSPDGMEINEDTGVIAWTPTINNTGLHDISVLVEDGRGGSANQGYAIVVSEAPPNRPPVITSTPTTFATPVIDPGSQQEEASLLDAYEYQVVASDPDDDTLTYSVSEGPSGLTIDSASGLVAWAPTVSQVGDHPVVIEVQDGNDGFVTQSYIICVKPTASNYAPAIISTPPVSAGSAFFTETELIPYQSEWHYEVVDFGEMSGFEAVDFDASNFEVGQGGFGEGTNCPLGGSALETFWPLNTDILLRRSVVLPPGATRVEIGAAIDNDIQVFVNGVDVSNGFQSSGGCAVRDSKIFSVPDDVLVEGENLVAIRARDSGVEGYVDVRMSASVPTVTGNAASGQTGLFEYQVAAIDPENDALQYGLTSETTHAGITIDPQTGLLSWPIPFGFSGKQTISVEATDTLGAKDQQVFEVDVPLPGNAQVSGYFFEDLNRNGIRDTDLIVGDDPDIVFVVDRSGSMQFAFEGDPVGDLNGDGVSDTRMDATIAGMIALHDSLIDRGFEGTAELSVVLFFGSGFFGINNPEVRTLDLDPSVDGIQQFTTLGADNDSNGTLDFVQAISTIGTGGGTHFDVGLQRAIDHFDAHGSEPASSNLIFFSDGEPNGGDFRDEVATLRNGGVNIQAFGIGDDSSLEALRDIDPETRRITSTDEFLDIFSGIDAGSLTFLEPSLPGWIVYADLNRDGVRNPGEPFRVSDHEGNYRFDSLPDGDYELRQELQAGWTSTAPIPNSHPFTLPEDAPFVTGHFGNILNSTDDLAFITEPSGFANATELFRYDAKVSNPNDLPLAFSLPFAPAGMTVHPTLGTVVWIPTGQQTGSADVSLRVEDSQGGVALQTFSIAVSLANSSPIITSSPGLRAVGTRQYRYNLRAQDAEDSFLSFSIEEGPIGAAIETEELHDEQTGELIARQSTLVWDVPSSAIGASAAFSVSVVDSSGGIDTQSWSVDVRDINSANTDPEITSTPRQSARVGLPWNYVIEASDSDGDRLTYSLNSPPAGMEISDLGLIEWDVPNDAASTVPVEVVVADGRGAETTQSFEIVLTSIDQNQTPVITSVPVAVAVIDQTYSYDAVAEDPDGDSFIWSLDAAPRGMSIDSQTGTIRWTPDDQQLGSHIVAVTATDPLVGQFTQRYELHVGCNNLAPVILSIPPTVALTDRVYLYAVRADDFEDDALTWSLVDPPAGMSINAQTAVIRWSPTTDQIASHDVAIEVSDGINIGTQAYKVVVSSSDELVDPNDPAKGTKGNRAPIFTSNPVFTAEVDSVYQYQVTAIDPDGDDLVLSLPDDAPSGMTINDGLITWTPAEADAGERVINVAATDEHGAKSTQGYLLSVTVNSPPEIQSDPVETATSGAVYRYTVRASDPDGDPLTYRLAEGVPDGMSIDRFGRIIWQSDVTDTDPQDVTVEVFDNRGQTDSQSWSIDMVADEVPPNVSITVTAGGTSAAGDAQVDIGSTYTVRVGATDNVGVEDVQLSVDGNVVSLDASGAVTLQATSIGSVALVAMAIDASGNEGTSDATLTVAGRAGSNPPPTDDPNLPDNPGGDPTDNQAPTVTITSPAIGDSVTNVVSIVGSVDDPEDNLWYYRAFYSRADRVSLTSLDLSDSDWVQFHQSTDEVVDGEIASFDPSGLGNDAYVIAVAAYDTNGRGFVQPTLVNVEGNVQLGNFQLSFTDLSLPLNGIPIEVTRSYDTLNANDEGDFGFGWTLGVQDARILEVGALGEGGVFSGGNDRFVPDTTKVYLTNPSGQRVGFTYKERLSSASFFGAVYTPYFEPDPGVYDTLTIDETQVGRGGILGLLGSGINPNVYTLTTKDGLRYRYGEIDGLRTITDLNDNVVSFTNDGISHSSGDSIEFKRDHRNRITEVVDTAGNSIVYTYDVGGDLTSVTNQAGLTTRYEYLDSPAHYLDAAYDSLDKRVVKAVYETNPDTGQLEFKGVIDAAGNRVDDRDFDTDNNTGILRDGNGNETTLIYDDRGNVLEEIDPLGNTTFREYNDAQNPDLETRIIDRRGFITDREYDARGNVMQILEIGTEVEPFEKPIVTRFTYDAGNRVRSITNAKNSTTSFQYDANGNLTQITNALGDTSSFTYDEQGRRASFTDFNGNVTTFDYTDACPCGSPSKVIFADDTYQELEYNQFGQVTREAYYEADDTLVELRETDYDRSGRVIEERSGVDGDPDHPQTVVRRFYDGQLLDWEIIVSPESLDADGVLLESPATPVEERKSRITDFEYDQNDRLIQQTDALGGVVEFRYDAGGNRVLLQDPVGNITTWVYDDLNRVSEERDPFYNEGLSIDEAINALETSSGASCEANTAADHVRLTCYDAEGNQSQTIDRNARRREFDYDHAGRLEEERWYAANMDDLVQASNFAYDVLGNMLTAVDPNSSYLYTYDILNRLTSVDNNPNEDRGVPRVILTYDYDAQGNVTLTEDDAGVTVESEYDSRNRLSVRKWYDADLPTGEDPDVDPARVDFFYNAAGREAEVRRYSDLDANTLVGRTERTYDLSGRSDDLIHRDALDELLAGYDYDYDFGGLLTHEARLHQDSQYEQTIDYEYDLTGQLTLADFDTQPDEVFVYDANGNRESSEFGDETRTYTTSTANQLVSDGTYRYEYDEEANQVKRVNLETGETRTFEYDHHNRLVRVDNWSSDPNGTGGAGVLTQSIEYAYDAFGRRVSRRATLNQAAQPSLDTLYFIYSSDNKWIDVSGSPERPPTRYLFGNSIDRILATHQVNALLRWHLADRLGSIRDRVTPAAEKTMHVTFSAFGMVLSDAENDISDAPLFTGREYDGSIGEYYFRARYYSPVNGTFQNVDPLGFSGGDLNLQRFVGNSPLNGIDPTGMTAIFSYAAQINNRLDSPALAPIGFLQGFATSSLRYVGHFLDTLDESAAVDRLMNDLSKLLVFEWAISSINHNHGVLNITTPLNAAGTYLGGYDAGEALGDRMIAAQIEALALEGRILLATLLQGAQWGSGLPKPPNQSDFVKDADVINGGFINGARLFLRFLLP